MVEYLDKLDGRQLYDFLSYSRGMISHAKISAIKSSRREQIRCESERNRHRSPPSRSWVAMARNSARWSGTTTCSLPARRCGRPLAAQHLSPDPSDYFLNISAVLVSISLSHPHSHFCPAPVCSSTRPRAQCAADRVRLRLILSYVHIYAYMVQGVPKPPA